jgi:peptidoglycan/xylan/chitin deacetylase (PgdA/CDA1 family)
MQLCLYLLVKSEKSTINNQDLDNNSRLNEEVYGNDVGFLIDTSFTDISQVIEIVGKGPINRIVALQHNERFKSSVINNDGLFKFPPQSLFLGKNKFIIWSLADGKAICVDSFIIDYSSQRIRTLSKPLTRVRTTENILALTFDGGSSANGADSIIKILETKNLKSTFFLTGSFIRMFPGIVKKLILDNHELANHTYSHPHLTTYTKDGNHTILKHVDRPFVYAQLNKTDSLLYTGFRQHFKPYWRAPFGEYNKEILNWAAEIGYKHVGWSPGCDTRDWVSDPESALYRTADEIYDYIINLESKGKLRGAVILMHLHSDRHDDMPYKILPKLIDTLRARKYKIVTISELITAGFST